MSRVELGARAPRNRLTQRPAPGALPVEPELGGQLVEPIDDSAPAVPELGRSDDRRETELALARERLGVDDEPRLALRSEHVVAMKILVDEDLLALGRRQLLEGCDRRDDKVLLEWSPRPLPLVADATGPPARLLGERSERRPRRLPEPR